MNEWVLKECQNDLWQKQCWLILLWSSLRSLHPGRGLPFLHCPTASDDDQLLQSTTSRRYKHGKNRGSCSLLAPSFSSWILPFVICFFLWVSTRNPSVYSTPSLWGFFWSYVQGAFLCPVESLKPVHYFFLNVYFTNSLVLFDISFLSYLNKTQGRKLWPFFVVLKSFQGLWQLSVHKIIVLWMDGKTPSPQELRGFS